MKNSKNQNVNNVNNVNKKTLVRKPLTDEQKEAIKQKRALNPTFAQVVGKQRKFEETNLRSNIDLVLLRVKKTVSNITLPEFNEFQNLDYQQKCIKFVNFILKSKKDKETGNFVYENEKLKNEAMLYAKKNVNGLFSDNQVSNVIGGIIKIAIDKNTDYQTSVNIYNAIQYKKAQK
jgi:hypothetical protein